MSEPVDPEARGAEEDSRLHAIGELFQGRYAILGELPWGGLGVHYAAEEAGRPVVLAVLPIDCSSRIASQAFEAFAERLEELWVPGVLPITDSGIQHGVPYLEIEPGEGSLLWELASGRPLPTEQALEIAVQLAFLIEACHAKGHVHGDLTPSNILLAPGMHPAEGVRIVGMGIAELIANTRGTELTGPTGRGSGPKATRFLAPEIALGKSPSARSDVYSLGALLAFMLHGAPPDRDGTPAGSLESVAGLEATVRRAMAADPEERFESVSSLRATLEALDPHRAPSLRPPAATAPEEPVGLAELLEGEAKAPPYSAAASSAMARGKAPRASASPAPRRGSGVGSWIGVAFLALLVGGGTYALLRPEAAPASGDTPARASLEAGPAAGESAAGEPAAGESAAGESAAGEPTVAPQPVIEPVIEPAIEPVIEPAIEPAIEPSAGSEPEPEPPIEPAPAPGSSTAHGLASSSSAGPLAGELPPVLAEALRRLDSSEELSEADLQPLYSYVTNHAFDARVHLVMGRSFVRMGWQRAAVEAYARAVRVGEDVHEDPLILGHLIELLSARDEFWDRSWPAIRDGWRARALPAVEEALESNTEWGAQRRLRRLHSRLSRFDSDEG